MANSAQDTLIDSLAKIVGGDANYSPATEDLVKSLTEGIAQGLSGGIASAITASTGGGGGGSVLKTVLESGLGLAPLIGGLIGLFGGGDSDAPPDLVKYTLPSAINFERAETAAGLSNVDYNQTGTPRAFDGERRPGAAGSEPGYPAQITVNVQAMDARSFLDHSDDIAAAVRKAMLHSNSINDVVNEL